MRRGLLPLLILCAVAIAAALAWLTLMHGMGRSADVVTETRPVEPFQRIEVSGRADVRLVQGTSDSVQLEASGRREPRVSVMVQKGTLEISARDSRRWWDSLLGARSRATPRITVTFRNLAVIGLSGAVALTADRIDVPQLVIAASGGSSVRVDALQTQALRVSGSGALKATLAGTAVEQDIDISGAGDVHAEKLVSQHARVHVSGAGSIVINAQKTLRASISGAGTVEYYGDPDVKESISGVGRVKRRGGTVAVL